MNEIEALQAHIIKLEDWGNRNSLEWAEMLQDEHVQVARVINECELLRRGIGVSYAAGDDPLEKLKRTFPSLDSINAVTTCIKKAREKLTHNI